MSSDRPSPLLTVAEAAERLSVTVHSVRRYIHGHQLAAVRIGREYRVEAQTLEAFIESRSTARAS